MTDNQIEPEVKEEPKWKARPVSETLPELRKERNLTVEQVSELLGGSLSAEYISYLEDGSIKADIGECALLAEVFGISLGKFLGKPERKVSILMCQMPWEE